MRLELFWKVPGGFEAFSDFLCFVGTFKDVLMNNKQLLKNSEFSDAFLDVLGCSEALGGVQISSE